MSSLHVKSVLMHDAVGCCPPAVVVGPGDGGGPVTAVSGSETRE